MSSPIAEHLTDEMRNGNDDLKLVQPHHHAREEAGYPEMSERDRQKNRPPITAGVGDFMSDLLDAQQKLIAAQYQFLHDGDLQALAGAQRDMIQVQTMVLGRLSVFG